MDTLTNLLERAGCQVVARGQWAFEGRAYPDGKHALQAVASRILFARCDDDDTFHCPVPLDEITAALRTPTTPDAHVLSIRNSEAAAEAEAAEHRRRAAEHLAARSFDVYVRMSDILRRAGASHVHHKWFYQGREYAFAVDALDRLAGMAAHVDEVTKFFQSVSRAEAREAEQAQRELARKTEVARKEAALREEESRHSEGGTPRKLGDLLPPMPAWAMRRAS